MSSNLSDMFGSSSRDDASGTGGVNCGDWICGDVTCSHSNFARRQKCKKCQRDRSLERSSSVGSSGSCKKKLGTEIGKAAAEKSRGLFSAEDWQCNKCANVNWARRMTCNMCNAPKFSDVEERTGFGGGYNDRGIVEYKERDESDSEYDEFGRLKKKRKNSNDASKIKSCKIENVNEEDDEEDGDDDDLAKYNLFSDDEEIVPSVKFPKKSAEKSKNQNDGTKPNSRRSRSRTRSVVKRQQSNSSSGRSTSSSSSTSSASASSPTSSSTTTTSSDTLSHNSKSHDLNLDKKRSNSRSGSSSLPRSPVQRQRSSSYERYRSKRPHHKALKSATSERLNNNSNSRSMSGCSNASSRSPPKISRSRNAICSRKHSGSPTTRSRSLTPKRRR